MDDDYAEVFREHHCDLVRGCTLSAGGDQDLAEDAVVEAFLRAYRPWRRGRVDDIGAYLQTTAGHEVRRLQARRARTVRPGSPVPAGVSAGADAGAVPFDEAVSDRAELVDLLAGLSDQERRVLVLRFWFDQREVDVAEGLGLPLGTVKSLAHRALERIRARPVTRGDDRG